MWIKFTEVLNATKRQFLLAIWFQTGSRIKDVSSIFKAHSCLRLNPKFACIVHSEWVFSRWPHCVTRGQNTYCSILFMNWKCLRAVSSHKKDFHSRLAAFSQSWLCITPTGCDWNNKSSLMSGDSNDRQGGKRETDEKFVYQPFCTELWCLYAKLCNMAENRKAH